jgi:hypothetical protein
MKKLIIISGSSFALLNLLFFIIISSYGNYPFLASEICIIISTALIYYVSVSKTDNAFKIFLLFLFSFFAIVKFILALFFATPLKDNYIFLTILIIIVIELLSLVTLKYSSKHA